MPRIARGQHLVAAHSLDRAEQPLDMARQRARRRELRVHHVAVEVRRAPNGLAGVVDDVVEPVVRRFEVVAEGLDARGVTEVECIDLEPARPVLEVGLTRVPGGSVPREARRDDESRTGAQELDPRLVADLHAPAGEQRDTSAQVGGLCALGEVEVTARRAELIVERVDLGVRLLADVAVLRLDQLARRTLGIGRIRLLEPPRREDVWARVHRLVPQRPDAGLRQRGFVSFDPGSLRAPSERLAALPTSHDVRLEDIGSCGE